MAGKGGSHKTGSQRVAIMERRAQCLEFRKAGLSQREIGARLGISLRAVQKHLEKALAAIITPGVEELRKLESERLDKLQSRLWVAAMNGDERTVRTIIALSRRRAAMLGLDAPVKTQPVDAGPDVPRRIVIPEADERPEPDPEG